MGNSRDSSVVQHVNKTMHVMSNQENSNSAEQRR